MQVADQASVAGPTFARTQTAGTVLCCLCGVPVAPNPTNMCVNCIRSQVDITEGIQKQVSLLWCKECGRYLQPPRHWLRAEPESKELLTYCIKRIRGLQKVKLVDASFIWTEPHSRRLKVKLTVQGEVLNGAILQQAFVVDFIVETNMCIDCTRAVTNPNVWTAVVQVRQHVEHKRTFFYLEQLILKHHAAASCLNIKEIHEGIDFFFNQRAHAQKFLDILQSVVPLRFRHDKQLVSHNEHTSSYRYKYTFSAEIAPVCRDDLICLPAKLSSSSGGIGPLVLCTRVSNSITLTDPATLRQIHMDVNAFYRAPFRAWHTSRQLVEYMVLDAEPAGPSNDKFVSADVQVARMSDFGSNDRTLLARTHLGAVLHAGDTALGYDLASSNITDPEVEQALAKGTTLPDVILVRKSYQERRQRRKARGAQRHWKLKRMGIDGPEEGAAPARSKRVEDPRTGDLERFMEELEEDPEMRSKVAMYRDPAYSAAREADRQQAGMSDDDEDADFPEVLLSELVDEMQDMQLAEGAEEQLSEEDGDDRMDG